MTNKTQEELDLEQSTMPTNSKGKYLITITGSTYEKEEQIREKEERIRWARYEAKKYGLEGLLEKELIKNSDDLSYFQLRANYKKLEEEGKKQRVIYLWFGIFIGVFLTRLIFG